MTVTSHDFEQQRRDTYAAFADIQSEGDLPETGDLELAFLAGDAADWDGFETALADAGYETERYIDDATPPEYEPYLLAIQPDHLLSALSIWISEETATRLALAHGFHPDGWGFMS